MIKGEFKSMKYAQISDILTLEFNINYVTQMPTFFHFFNFSLPRFLLGNFVPFR